LESFTASAKEKAVEVKWVVSEEVNVRQYEVQFSADGNNFRTVGTVPAINSRHYSLTHTGTVAGANYYRLKTVDRDNKTIYSNINRVNFAASSTFSIYPNPAVGTVNVSIAASMSRKPGTISVIAINGYVVIQQHFNVMQNKALDISKLAPGSYVIRITSGDEVSNRPLQIVR
jgi:hypothetical protein